MPNGRKLIYIPILHTQHDMGSLAEGVRETTVKKVGKKLWQHHVRAIDEMWGGIRQRIVRMNLSFNHVYLYQDGLPLCGKEKPIVTELANQGSPNHRILEWMINHGATLVGTENPKLLIQEYNFIKQILSAPNNKQKEAWVKQYEKAAPKLMNERDRFISDQINKTLPMGGVGFLFIGLLHRVDELLAMDIRVSYLIYRLPFQRSFEMELAG